MKCYICKKELSKGRRLWISPVETKLLSGFRTVCEECFAKEMVKMGNVLHDDGYWYKSKERI